MNELIDWLIDFSKNEKREKMDKEVAEGFKDMKTSKTNKKTCINTNINGWI